MANRFGKWHINLPNFTSPHMGKVQGRMMVKLFHHFFCQTLCAGNFLLGTQSLVKSNAKGKVS